MKKLLAIVASALTLGAFADAGNTPMTFELPEGLAAGTEVSLVCDGEVVHTTKATSDTITYSTEGLEAGEYWLELANGTPITESLMIGTVASAPQFAMAKYATTGYTIVDTDFTKATSCPEIWTAKRGGSVSTGSFTFNTNGAIANTGWGENKLITTCDITNADTVTIDVVTYSNNTENYNMVLSLGSSDYSVSIGNSYDNTNGKDGTAIKVGSIEGDSATKFMCFQSGTGTNPGNIAVVAEKTDLNVKSSLTYHLIVGEGKLVGTVTDGTTTKNIEFELPETFAFTSFGIDLAGPANGCGVKSVKITEGIVEPRTLYLDPSCFGTEDQHPDIAALDWTSSANVKIVDADGNEVTDRTDIDTIVIRDSVNLGIRPEITGLKLVIDNNATVGFPMAGSGMNYCLEGVDVEVKAGSKVKITRTWGSGWTKDGTDIFNIKNTSIHGAGVALVNSDVTVQLESSSITLPISGTGTVNAFAGMKLDSTWAGTVKVASVASANWLDLASYGTANSTIELAGITEGYISVNNNITATLKLTGDVNLTDGSSSSTVTIAKLDGTGNFSATKNTTYVFNAIASTYTGALTNGNGSTMKVKTIETAHATVPSAKTKVLSISGTINTSDLSVKLADGTAIDAEKISVESDGIYILAPAPVVPTEITGGSKAQQTAYVAWADAAGVTDPTTKGAAEAFALNLTAEKLADKTVEQAVKDELDELLKTIDANKEIDLLAIMQAVVASTSDGTITLDGYENATIKLVPATLGEGVTTDAKLFRLKVEFNAKGQN